MQTIISLLDVGVSATISRSTTLYLSGQLDQTGYRKTVTGIELVFFIVSIPIAMTGLFAELIAVKWLNLDGFPQEIAQDSIVLIFLLIAFRWMQTFYRAIITGAERLVWLGWFNIVISTFRIVGVIPYLIFISGSVVDFFYYQIFLNVIELITLFVYSGKLSGIKLQLRIVKLDYSALSSALKNSFVIGMTSLVWAVIAQADKFLASGQLKLADYTAYSLVITVSSVMILLSSPLIYPIGPAMARMLGSGDKEGAIRVFRQVSLYVSIFLGSATAILIGWGYEVLFAWTGDHELAKKSYSYLPIYISGSLLFALSYLSYAINFAIGNFSKRLKYSLLTLFIYFPLLAMALYCSKEFGLIYSWFIVNFLFFFIAQRGLYKELDLKIYEKSMIQDILIPISACMLVIPLIYVVDMTNYNRLTIVFCCFLLFILSVFCGLLLADARNFVRRLFFFLKRD